MGMFLNYQNIADNYKPNNLINAFPHKMNSSKLDPLDASKPFEEYNAKGELSGYFWRQGETLNLEFNIDGEITLEANAILLTSKGQEPTVDTLGKVNQRAYNVVDLRSWTCSAVTTTGKYIWEEDAEFTYPLNSDRSVYISAADYLKDKKVEVTLYNFRMEPIHKELYPHAAPTIVFKIDRELSNLLPKGIYHCSVTVFNDDVCYTIFDTNDCDLLVK